MSANVCVLMCTYNGEKYIKRQMDSLMDQKDVQVYFCVHDDGSSDSTPDILKSYGITPVGADHMGPAKGFMYLLEAAPDSDYYAFCDQDDIWDDDKLSSAIDMIRIEEQLYPDEPCIYGCSTRLVSEDEKYICDHLLDKTRTLSSRLFYASISGNTVVFNRAMRELALKTLPDRLIMHDSWMVKLCVATGGHLIIDERPHMDYRMHGANQIGMEMGLSDKLSKFRKVSGNDGEGQEFLDICSLYEDSLQPWVKRLAELAESSRTSKQAARTLLKEGNIDFKNTGFNIAFRRKVLKGHL